MAAENSAGAAGRAVAPFLASMRPRRMAAENEEEHADAGPPPSLQ